MSYLLPRWRSYHERLELTNCSVTSLTETICIALLANGTDIMAIMNKLQILEDKQFYADDTDRFNMFFSFVTTFVIKLYGENYIPDKVKANPGSTIWDYVTSSDVSYGITQVVNGMDRWKQEYEISQMPEEEQDKYKKEEVRKKLPKDEQEKYVRFQGKFTTRLRFYKKLWRYWKDMFRDKDWFDMMLVAWQVWVEENKFGQSGVQGEEEGCF